MRSEAKAEIRSKIKQFFHSLNTQNLELMEDLLPEDDESMVHIGTERDEIWKGYDDLLQSTREQFENLNYYKAQIRDLTINVSQSGDTAWYFHRLDAEINSSGETHSWTGARFTGVFEKRNGNWKMVQTHVSIPESG